MAMSPGPRRRGTTSGDRPEDQTTEAPLTPMQEPLGSMDRPVPRTSDDNDVNIASNGVGRRAGNLDRTGTAPRGGGFTTTFVIVAAILVAAFLVALYLGSDRFYGPQPVADTTPGTGDTTGSTVPVTPAPVTPQETAPAGGGTTPPANP